MARSGMTKAALRSLYPPLTDGGDAAGTVIEHWKAHGVPKSVFCYVSFMNECQTAPILCFCLQSGIPLCVPLCEPDGVMTARRVSSFTDLRRGRYGILEPPADAEIIEYPALVIVPGIAFGRDGTRLGRGGGYYDRYLAGRDCVTVGLCRSDRLLRHIPCDGWDIPVQMIATEWRMEECRKKRKEM